MNVSTRIGLTGACLVGMMGTAKSGSRDPKLPDSARTAIAVIAQAAKNRDLTTIREHMIEEFTYSFGGNNDAGEALQVWADEPRYLRALWRVLRRGCHLRDADHVVCPGRGDLRSEAASSASIQGGCWRLSSKEIDVRGQPHHVQRKLCLALVYRFREAARPRNWLALPLAPRLCAAFVKII